jgi:hypothetical protein
MSHPVVLFLGPAQWRLALADGEGITIDAPAADDALAIEQAIVEAIDQLKAKHAFPPHLLVALPSSSCLCASISTDDLDRGRRRRAMSYALEEHLPIAAEQMVFDYQDHGRSVLGVCIETDAIAPIIQACQSQGLSVGPIVPAAMLTAMHASEQQPDADAFVIGEGAIDIILLEGGKPVRWQWFAEDRNEAAAYLRDIQSQRDQPLKRIDFGRALLDQSDDSSPVADATEPNAMSAAAACGQKVLEGRLTPWFDLRRDALARPNPLETYRRSLAAVVVGLVLLLVGVLGMSLYRGGQYAQLADGYRSGQVARFKQVLPDQRLPVNITGRLRSEARKLAGLSGHGEDAADVASLRPTSALIHLHGILASLPPRVKLSLADLSIQPKRIQMRGQTLSHGDAEAIADALRATGRYEVDPPRSQALRGAEGVDFRFAATPRDRQALTKAGAP